MGEEVAGRVSCGIGDRRTEPACRPSRAAAAGCRWHRASLCRPWRSRTGRCRSRAFASRIGMPVRAGRMVDAIAKGQHAEDDQRGDLHDVDGDVDGRGCARALLRDPRHEEREDDRDQRHEDGPGLEPLMKVGIEEADHIADEDARDRHHHAGIDPVVKVRAPADDELGDAGIFEGLVL